MTYHQATWRKILQKKRNSQLSTGDFCATVVAQLVKNLPAMQETLV